MNTPLERLAQILKDAPPEELKNNARAAAAAILARLNVVSREEFDFRCEMLEQTAARMRELEERIARLEQPEKPEKPAGKSAAKSGKPPKTGAKPAPAPD